jgi:hypothetical protein
MCYVLCVMCYVLCVVCCVLCVMCYVLCVVCYVLCVMCYVLCVMYYMSYIIKNKNKVSRRNVIISLHHMNKITLECKCHTPIVQSAEQVRNTECHRGENLT